MLPMQMRSDRQERARERSVEGGKQSGCIHLSGERLATDTLDRINTSTLYRNVNAILTIPLMINHKFRPT